MKDPHTVLREKERDLARIRENLGAGEGLGLLQ